MFTGIIREMGKIISMRHKSEGIICRIECGKILANLNTGDSISVNGVCLTITSKLKNSFDAFISGESLSKTTLGKMKSGTKVNLEPPLTLSGGLSGHILQGHIDGIGAVFFIEKKRLEWNLTIKTKKEIVDYMVEKGSVGMDGISLTITNLKRDSFSMMIIPETIKNTIVSFYRTGTIVNIECDIIGKYIKHFLIEDKR